MAFFIRNLKDFFGFLPKSCVNLKSSRSSSDASWSESGSSELALGLVPLNSSFSLVLLSVSNSVGSGYESGNYYSITKCPNY